MPPLGVKSGQATADVGSPSAIIALTEGQLELCRKLSISNKKLVAYVAKSPIFAFKNQSTEYVETMYRTFFHGLDTTAREKLTAKTFLRNHEEKGFRRHDLESVLRIRAKNPTTHPKAMFDA